MRTALVGAVESTRVALEALAHAGAPPAAVFTLPPERSGQHSDFVDLAPAAAAAGSEVVYAPDVNALEALARMQALELDYLLVIGWSRLCRAPVLEVARGGAVGYHPAALPRNRGRAVIPWTILQGLEQTASTLFWMEEGADTGDLLLQEPVPVAPDETAATLYARHMEALRRMLAVAVPLLAAGNAPRLPQDHSLATYCARRTAADGWIDWSRPAREVWTLVRASSDPYPGAFTIHRGERLVVWEAELAGAGPYVGTAGQVQALAEGGALVRCGDGEHVLLRVVQLGDGPRLPAAEVLKNHVRLGPDPWALARAAAAIATTTAGA